MTTAGAEICEEGLAGGEAHRLSLLLPRLLLGIPWTPRGRVILPGDPGSSISSNRCNADSLFFHALNMIQLPNTVIIEMGIVSTLINDLRDGLISVNTAAGC